MRLDYSDDIDVLARLGSGVGHLDQLASGNLNPGQLAEFMALDRPTRILVLKLLGGEPGAQDELDAHPDAKTLAQWLLTLPAYAPCEDDPDDDDRFDD